MSSRVSRLPVFDPNAANPSYGVRHSPRTRRLTLRVYPGARVEVTVPTATARHVVEEFVARHRDWIERRVATLNAAAPTPADLRPEQVRLRAFNEVWNIDYVAAARVGWRVPEPGSPKLRLHTGGDDGHVPRLLRAWLTATAEQRLAGWLGAVASHYGFRYNRVQFRRQRTRWGSCSRSGTISLNVCLLFQSPEVVRYLLLHELCHTRHMNHSDRFWGLVAECEPEWRVLDRELSRGWRHVPHWIFV